MPTEPCGVLLGATRRLAAAGVPNPRWDAEQLLAHAVGRSRAGLVAVEVLDADQLASYDEMIGRRAAREPLQHIVGSIGFRYVDLAVGPGVFVPRPESEVVAGAVVEAARSRGAAPLVVDLCSGSGAIAVSVAHEAPGSTVHAVEVDPAAYAWLERNAAPYPNLVLHLSDAASALPDLDGAVDVVVSNPPYVPERDLARLEAEVAEHDPAIAYLGGADGLDVIRVVSGTAARLLHGGGAYVVEHAADQGEAVPELLAASGAWEDIADWPDLLGRARYATATRR